MHVIWKRPDGFQNALPEDFRRISLSNGAHLWLHRHEQEWYPFQVSGDWSGQTDTKRLNKLVNMLDATQNSWMYFLEHTNDNEIGTQAEDSISQIAQNNLEWLKHLDCSIKGTNWEIEIIKCALADIMNKIKFFTTKEEIHASTILNMP